MNPRSTISTFTREGLSPSKVLFAAVEISEERVLNASLTASVATLELVSPGPERDPVAGRKTTIFLIKVEVAKVVRSTASLGLASVVDERRWEGMRAVGRGSKSFGRRLVMIARGVRRGAWRLRGEGLVRSEGGGVTRARREMMEVMVGTWAEEEE